MLVPEAILQAGYAAPIRKALSERFRRVLLVHIRDRLFEGTDEAVVVVAAAGYGKPGKIVMKSIEDADDLEDVLNGTTTWRCSKHITVVNGRNVSTATIGLLDELEQHEHFRRISDIAKVRIGLVTGANNHFIRNLEDLDRLGVPNQARYQVVSRTRWLSGLDFTKEDHEELARTEQRAFLVRPAPRLDNREGILRWIEEGESAGVKNRYKCAQRSHWYRVELPDVPDMFATCTRLGPPLVVINKARFRCSNALHALHWLPGTQVEPETVAVGFLTSAVSVWAELHGRRYGGGVLKTEPGKLAHAPFPMIPAALEAYDELNRLMRAGRESDARLLADRLVLGEGLCLPSPEIRRLQKSLKDLMSQRIPSRRENKSA